MGICAELGALAGCAEPVATARGDTALWSRSPGITALCGDEELGSFNSLRLSLCQL